MIGEIPPAQDSLDTRVIKRARQAFLGCSAAALVAAMAPVGLFIKQHQNTGSVDCYFPDSLKDRPVQYGQKGMTWNTAGKALRFSPQILGFMDSGGNVAMLQEVPREDYEAYARIMQYRKRPYSVCYVQADAKPKMFRGGLGNMIITDQIPEDTVAYRMKGRSLDGLAKKIGGALIKDLGNLVSVRISPSTYAVGLDLTFKNLHKADEEDRAILAFTLKMKGVDGKTVRVRGLTGHISGHDPYRSRQLRRLEEIIKLNIKPFRPLFIGCDSNTDPEQKVPMLEKHGIYTQLTEPTSKDRRVIDYIGHSASADLGIVTIRRGDYFSDHYNVVYRFQTQFIDYPVLLRIVW